MSFSDIPVRGFADVDPSWWNALRTAGARLESLIPGGAGSIASTAFTFAQGASAANITGLTFDATVTKDFKAEILVRRKTTTNEVNGKVTINGWYNDLTTSWELGIPIVDGPDLGLTFSISTTSGVAQLKYTSSTISGSTYNGASKFSAEASGL